MLLALIQAGLALLIGFGVTFTADQVALLTAFIAAVFGVITRSQVSPAWKG
jgi:hypothetical protein